MEDSHIISFSVDAMSNVAKQFNHTGVNIDRMHTQLVNAQDSIAEYMNQSDQIRDALSMEITPSSAPTEDDLQNELDALLEDDSDTPTTNKYTTLMTQLPSVPINRAQQLTPPSQNVLETPRARHAI